MPGRLGEVAKPDRVSAKTCHESGVGAHFGELERGSPLWALAVARGTARQRAASTTSSAIAKQKRTLAASHQLAIDLDKNLRV